MSKDDDVLRCHDDYMRLGRRMDELAKEHPDWSTERLHSKAEAELRRARAIIEAGYKALENLPQVRWEDVAKDGAG